MRLIDADALKKKTHPFPIEYAVTLREINESPTIDPESLRPQGRLISTGYDEMYCEFGNCTVCGADNPMHNKYCCECGARLDRGVDDEGN